jgi:GDP-mannose 6-dehydrogenase
MKISIFGLGYVGCVSLGCLAQNGHTVIGVDTNRTKIDLINQGRPTIIEKDIDGIIAKTFEMGKIRATDDYADAVQSTEVSIIAVGTPSTNEGHLNLNFIYKVAEEIGEALRHVDHFHVVVIRSTVLPGTNKKLGTIIEKTSKKVRNIDFAVVSNPEFLREGSAVKDYYNPAVTVLGSENELALQKMAELYNDINAPIKKVSAEVAEIIKFINNSFHAIKICFANEVGNICKGLGLDSHEVMDLFVMDTKLNLSPYYLKPGFAYGGSCLPKDLKGLCTLAHDKYLSLPVLEHIDASNRNQKQAAIKMIEEAGNRKLGLLGLSFKAGTDDLRYSPIVDVAEYFLGKGYEIAIHDENVNLSKLTGTNKEFIDQHIFHLSDLIRDDMDAVISGSETIVITHKIDGFDFYIRKYPEKKFIDLARVTDNKYSNYEGICW